MTDSLTKFKLTLTTLLAIAAFASLMLAAPRQAEAATATCPTFRVLHNDRIGKVSFPAGTYGMTVLDSTKLTCREASSKFAQFLQDWDGILPAPWTLKGQGAGKATFRRGANSATGFTVQLGGGGGGGGGQKAACPGYFHVLHNDRIGSFYVPKGYYKITLINDAKFTCPMAVKDFQQFLLDFDGQLPWPWTLNHNTATFYKVNAKGVGFSINKVYNPPNPGPTPVPGARKWIRCPGTFSVLNNDRIGALVLPKGPYFINVLSNPTLSCPAASNDFRTFLNYPSGKLPGGWKLNAYQAKFTQGPGSFTFKVKKAYAPR